MPLHQDLLAEFELLVRPAGIAVQGHRAAAGGEPTHNIAVFIFRIESNSDMRIDEREFRNSSRHGDESVLIGNSVRMMRKHRRRYRNK